MALHPYDLYDVRSLLSEEERAVQDTVARFTDERVLPIIGDCFDQGRFPTELIPEIAGLGLLGATLPEEYGGAGLNGVSYRSEEHTSELQSLMLTSYAVFCLI